MPKPFDTNDDLVQSTTDTPRAEQFQFQEDDRLKQEDDYRQGKSISVGSRASSASV